MLMRMYMHMYVYTHVWHAHIHMDGEMDGLYPLSYTLYTAKILCPISYILCTILNPMTCIMCGIPYMT